MRCPLLSPALQPCGQRPEEALFLKEIKWKGSWNPTAIVQGSSVIAGWARHSLQCHLGDLLANSRPPKKGGAKAAGCVNKHNEVDKKAFQWGCSPFSPELAWALSHRSLLNISHSCQVQKTIGKHFFFVSCLFTSQWVSLINQEEFN